MGKWMPNMRLGVLANIPVIQSFIVYLPFKLFLSFELAKLLKNLTFRELNF